MLSLAVAVPAFADDHHHGFIDREYTADGEKAKYVLFLPHDYGHDTDKKYPVILFLHGSGETGSDNVKQVKVGLGPAIKKGEKKFPFIAIFPQASHRKVAVRGRWAAGNPDAKTALGILDEVMSKHSCDPKRVYLTGLSMGGYGTWSLAAAHPKKWAAIAPVCGGGDPAEIAPKVKGLPIWCFHGDADRAVPVEQSRKMIAAIKEAGGEPKYTEYPGVGHNSWDRAYGTPELYDWFLEHESK